MKVPRITVGVDHHPFGQVYLVDHIRKTFNLIYPALGGELGKETSMELYDPAPTVNNFLTAVRQWDYHYRASDDPRLYEEGREFEQALIVLFKRLPEEDKQQCRKIVEIVVMSTESK